MKTEYKCTSDKSMSAHVPVLPSTLLRAGLCSCVLMLFCSSAECLATPALASQEAAGGSDAVKVVLDMLKGSDPDMQTVAITMVRELKGKEVTEALVKELPNLSITGQIQLLAALADRGDRAVLPAVTSLTKSKEQSVRVAALKALGQLGDESSVLLLVQTAADPATARSTVTSMTSDEQKAARESLYRLRGSEVDKEILARIEGAEPKIKVELIRAMGERNINSAMATLLKTALDQDSRVQQESFKVLRVIADQKYLPVLVQLLVDVKNESVYREAEKTITVVALKIENKDRQADVVLSALPRVVDVQKRCLLLTVLGKIGNETALAAIRAALKTDSEKERDAAVRALSDWPNPAPINDLLAVAKTSENEVHKILALRGFIRLVGLDENRPADEAVKMYQQAMELSGDVREKRLVLSGLAKVKSLAALEFAASYLQDSVLQQEAEVAVVEIAEGIYKDNPRQTKDVLNKIIQASKNDSLRQQAEEMIKKIDEGR